MQGKVSTCYMSYCQNAGQDHNKITNKFFETVENFK